MVYGTYNYSYWGESKPTYNWFMVLITGGALHCMPYPFPSFLEVGLLERLLVLLDHHLHGRHERGHPGAMILRGAQDGLQP